MTPERIKQELREYLAEATELVWRTRVTLHEQHQARHEALDEALLELWDDFALHFPHALQQNTTVGQLRAWSQQQKLEPTDPPDERFMCAHCRETVEEPHIHICLSSTSLEVNGNVE